MLGELIGEDQAETSGRMGHKVRVQWTAFLDNPGTSAQCLVLLDDGDVPELRLLSEEEVGKYLSGEAELPDAEGRWVCNWRHEVLLLARALTEAAMLLPRADD